MSDVLLKYNFQTVPSPLKISSSQTSTDHMTMGSLLFEITKSKSILCKEIAISVPIGNLEQEVYFNDPNPEITLSNRSWSASSAVLHKFDGSNLDYISFTIFNNTNNSAILNPLRISISGTVNHLEGQSKILLRELSTEVNANNFQIRSKSFAVNKTKPPSFYLRNFLASEVDDPTQVLCFFKYRKPFMLKWESNGESYELLQSGINNAIYSGTESTFTISAGIDTPATFMVRAKKGSEILYDTITVFVETPDILANNLTVNWATNFNYQANVKGITTMDQAVVTDNINITNATAKGTVDLMKANIQVFGKVQWLGQFSTNGPKKQQLQSATINPVEADGIVYLTYTTPEPGSYSAGIQLNDIYIAQMGSQENCVNNISAGAKTISCFVPKGSKLYLYAVLKETASLIHIYWQAIGSNKIPTIKVAEEVNSKLLSELNLKSSQLQDSKQKKAEKFITKLGSAMKTEFEKEDKKELTKMLLEM